MSALLSAFAIAKANITDRLGNEQERDRVTHVSQVEGYIPVCMCMCVWVIRRKNKGVGKLTGIV